MARDVDLAWRELADMQQAGLDAALAAKTKSQKSKATKAASESAPHSNAAATGLHPDSNGMQEGPSVLPNQDAASEADAVNGPDEGTHAEANGHPASEENLAANKQLPPGTSSVSMSQVGKLPPLYIPCALCQSHSSSFACFPDCLQSVYNLPVTATRQEDAAWSARKYTVNLSLCH